MLINMIEFLLKLFLTKGVPTLWKNRKTLKLYFQTRFGKYRKQKIRFSISYLYRIRIPHSNKYLLVFNRRIENQLQPVGGVYKRYGADHLFESWGHMPDCPIRGVGVDRTSDGDLRFCVDGKHVINVVKWFEEGMERETSANREFIEELVDTAILDREIFRKIKYKQIGRYSKHLKWSDHHKCYEVLIYDIVELLPTPDQETALLELAEGEKFVPDRYAIVESSDIEQLRLMKDGQQIARIGEHTKYTINQK